MELSEKYQKLQSNLRSLGSVCVAFSGGVDSTFLLYVAHQVLGSSAIAVTAQSCSLSRSESLTRQKPFVSPAESPILSVGPRNWILRDSARIPKTAVIFASMNCLKRYGRLQSKME